MLHRSWKATSVSKRCSHCLGIRTILLAFGAALLWLPAHATADPRIIDSRIWASGVSSIPPTWIDSERVLFLTGPGFKMNERVRSLAIWDVKGQARIQRANVNEYCFRDGVIVYKVLDIEDRRLIRGTWFRGKLGHEQEFRRDVEGDTARVRDPINCTLQTISEQQREAQGANRRLVPLREGHGYLDFGPWRGPESLKNNSVRYSRGPSSAAVDLGLGRYQIAAPREYYKFADSYLLGNLWYGKAEGPNGRRDSNDLRLAWTMTLDGALTEHIVTDGPWAGGPVPFPHLTARGIVFVNTSSVSRAYGLYLSTPVKPRRLVGGYVSRVGVSADGCRLAFSSAPHIDADRADHNNRRTLKSIDLCKG
jgi:hypothetical protein